MTLVRRNAPGRATSGFWVLEALSALLGFIWPILDQCWSAKLNQHLIRDTDH